MPGRTGVRGRGACHGGHTAFYAGGQGRFWCADPAGQRYAVQLAAQGLYIGFGGACTFNGAKRAAKAIEALPLDAIVLETDCPYMAPEPVRGTRCDSSLIRYVGEYIAQLRGISVEEVFRTTAENARRVYGL